MNFSQRKGYKPIPQQLQREGMSTELRNQLWNMLDLFVWRKEEYSYLTNSVAGLVAGDKALVFWYGLWSAFFRVPIDRLPSNSRQAVQQVRNHFFDCEWHEVYDLLEFVLPNISDPDAEKFTNSILERELSAYRYVSSNFTEVTDEQELASLNAALIDNDFPGARQHLQRALELLSDRKNPDYRNSIKESISAVEGLARIVSGNDKATLGDALDEIERSGKLHPALKKGFAALYGYTNDADGIRHAIMDEPDLTADDAKYFLLSCASFTNYLKSKMPMPGKPKSGSKGKAKGSK